MRIAGGSMCAVLVVATACSSPSTAPTPAPGGSALPIADATATRRSEPTVGARPSPSPEPSPSPGLVAGALLFDDFSYADATEMAANGWILRTTPGWPGLAGAEWSADAISLVDDPDPAGNRALRLTSTTDRTPEGTTQTQICHDRKYRDGTYASRMRFSNDPASGPDGDVVIQSFYAITPYEEPLDPAYSELDFEYLPNGGWGESGSTLWVNSWEKVQIEPWIADNSPSTRSGDFAGWHTLVMRVLDGAIDYFIDGDLLASHGEPYYPESPMSINHNLWFFADGLIGSDDERTYSDEIDWTFHAAGTALSPEEVEAAVTELRDAGTSFVDTVPDWSPPRESPCDL